LSKQDNLTNPDNDLFDSIQNDFQINKKKIYLNNGSITPLPISSIKSITDFCLRYSETGPDSTEFNAYLDDLKKEVKKRIADLIHCREDEIIFTQSTTEGINMIAKGLNWKIKDHLLVRNSHSEHFSNYLPWIKTAADFNLGIEIFPNQDITCTGSALNEEFEKIYNKQNYRLVSTSHVMYNNGSITPVEYLGKVIKKNHNDTLYSIDGAQSVGAINVDVNKINCDFMTFPSFKWLCGPLGLGILFVKKRIMDKLNPIFVGSGSAEVVTNPRKKEIGFRDAPKAPVDNLVFFKYPEKYHATFRNFPALAGLEASLRYILRIGINNIQSRNKYLSSIVRDEILKSKDFIIHEADEEKYRSSLISFSFKRKNNEKIKKLNTKLQEQGIILAEREIRERKILRASPHFYNSENDIQKASESIKILANNLD